ncbi:MAG: Hsp20/alpha crystallin family protein [Deltaproteobacteria bacterium]|nr:Hsp20/alpha crystallin family protein [Deltaproteobacteria bacterium]
MKIVKKERNEVLGTDFNVPKREDFNFPKMLENFFSDKWLSSHAFTPTIDVTEDAKAIHVEAELPGMDENDIKVELTDGYLNISGEKREESEKKGKNVYRLERKYGSFSRTLPLGNNIDENRIVASYKKGILKIDIPKLKINTAKKIKIAG